jgi:general stress protein 26
MADLKLTKNDPKKQLFEMIADVKAGFLGLEGLSDPMQPMAPYTDAERGSLWFFTKTDADLYKLLGGGARAQFCVVGANHDYHASLIGILTQHQNEEQIDKMWNDIVAAWFEHGKDDPALVLLEFKLQHAAIWASVGNPLVFGWEIARAHLQGDEPELGVRTSIDF